MASLSVVEIFRSLQGEAARAGLACSFVRLAGCNLRCKWCDTQYAWQGGRQMSVRAVLDELAALQCGMVEVTGGEPLLQPACLELLSSLRQAGYVTLLETNGTMDISAVDESVVRIMDIKCPSSGQAEATYWKNISHLRPGDEVKFVIADRGDFDYAARVVAEHDLSRRCPIIFSPVWARLALSELAGWILDSRLDVRLGVQLHRLIWPEKDRGV